MTYVVIGANYGDEGKGLMTDYLTRQHGVDLVCRFNGGAQAGHTVVDGDYTHVYKHIGSGHKAGAQTYLGKRFIVNPLLLVNEVAELSQTVAPAGEVVVHPDAMVTTFYDMVLNASLEEARGVDRHGSCGFGINETVTRHLAGFNLMIKDVKSASLGLLTQMIEELATMWVPSRAHDLGLSRQLKDPNSLLSKTLDPANYAQYASDLLNGAALLTVMDSNQFITGSSVLFEGAQGLALDELLGEFPHVTRSLTGLPYAIEQAAELGLEYLQPLYVTRCYATRHGAGPLPNDNLAVSNKPLVDTTNVTNQWQGKLRYAPLDIVALRRRIQADYDRSTLLAHMVGVELNSPEVAVTCLDQVGMGAWFDVDGFMQFVQVKDIPQFIENAVGFKVTFTSAGPTATTVSIR
jgi:adenylosuccinate synthase